MARRRFLVPQIRDDTAEILGDDARHLARVLRAVPGQQYEISDGAQVCLAEVTVIEKDRVGFRVLHTLDPPEIPVRLVLLAALIKFDRFEWLVEKSTELGVAAIVPVAAARSEKGLLEAARRRVERWRRIAHESSQQCRRAGPPEVLDPRPLAEALAANGPLRYFLDESPGPPPLLSAIPPAGARAGDTGVGLMTGPEGGWTESERAQALASGWSPVSLGPLILRAETAAITAAGLVMQAWWATRLE